jgi:hypothetical protein
MISGNRAVIKVKFDIAATLSVLALILGGLASTRAEGPDSALQAKVDAFVQTAQSWATNAVIVRAVTAHNTSPPAEYAAMTQEKWKALSVLDPFVRSFTRNEAAEYLKAQRTPVVTEAFLSGADGRKVAFLTKPTNWSHLGKAKHEAPMTGKCWQGVLEVDESNGQRQLQIAVPVIEDGKPIGSLVIGLSPSRMAKQ